MATDRIQDCVLKFIDTLLSTYHDQTYIGCYINCLKELYTLSKLPPWFLPETGLSS